MNKYRITYDKILEIIEDFYSYPIDWNVFKKKVCSHIMENLNISVEHEKNFYDVFSSRFFGHFKTKYLEVVRQKKGFSYFKTKHNHWLSNELVFEIVENEHMDVSDEENGDIQEVVEFANNEDNEEKGML